MLNPHLFGHRRRRQLNGRVVSGSLFSLSLSLSVLSLSVPLYLFVSLSSSLLSTFSKSTLASFFESLFHPPLLVSLASFVYFNSLIATQYRYLSIIL